MTGRRSLRSRVLLVFVLTLLFLALLLVFDPKGLSETSAARRAGVFELAVFQVEPEVIPVSDTTQDFDGDGLFDVVGSQRSSHDTWFGSTITESTLYVETLAGERLLALPSGGGAAARWYGDYDGNGTMDVVFEIDGDWHVFGFVTD